MNKLQEAYEAYEGRRAQEKYDGKVEPNFPLKEFRKCTDYLTGVLAKAAFDAEDLGDMVRVADARRRTGDRE